MKPFDLFGGGYIGYVELFCIQTKYCSALVFISGIVPITCERLFQGIDAKKEEKSDKEYQVRQQFLCRHIF